MYVLKDNRLRHDEKRVKTPTWQRVSAGATGTSEPKDACRAFGAFANHCFAGFEQSPSAKSIPQETRETGGGGGRAA